MTPQERSERRQMLRARLQVTIEAAESLILQLIELDMAEGKKPQGRRRRGGLRVIDGGRS